MPQEFAEKFAELHGARYALCIANGTIALIAALQAAGIRFGDEVIVPAYTWDGTATAVLFAGGIPVFADVDPDTYCLDVASAAGAITPRTRAIIPVHLAMRFTDMNALIALAEKHGLKIIEDCAHAHGGQFEGRGAGSMGDLGCFSFQESKLMTAGEGGIVLTNDLAHFEHLQSQVNCGRASLTDQYQQQRARLELPNDRMAGRDAARPARNASGARAKTCPRREAIEPMPRGDRRSPTAAAAARHHARNKLLLRFPIPEPARQPRSVLRRARSRRHPLRRTLLRTRLPQHLCSAPRPKSAPSCATSITARSIARSPNAPRMRKQCGCRNSC